MTDIRTIWNDGLWRNNAGLVQLLGLCPLLAVSTTVANGIGLGLATLFTLLMSNTLVSLIRSGIPKEVRIPAFVIIIATAVSAVEMMMQAFQYELYQSLGIFVPLIVTNCAILGRAEAFASRQPLMPSIHDALATGTGFMIVLLTLGALRELIGNGSLLVNLDRVLGSWSEGLAIRFSSEGTDSGFLLMLLPPGAFITLGFLIAATNRYQRWRHQNRQVQATGLAAESRGVQ